MLDLVTTSSNQLIIVTSTLGSHCPLRFLPLFEHILNQHKKVLIIWGLIDGGGFKENRSQSQAWFLNLKEQLSPGNLKKANDLIKIIPCSCKVDSNYLIIDRKIIFFQFSIFDGRMKDDCVVLPLVISDGKLPVKFLEFTIDHVSRRYPEEREDLAKIQGLMAKEDESTSLTTSNPKIFVSKLKNALKLIEKAIQSKSLDALELALTLFNDTVKNVEPIDTSFIIENFQHQYILHDLIEETGKSLYVVSCQEVHPKFFSEKHEFQHLIEKKVDLDLYLHVNECHIQNKKDLNDSIEFLKKIKDNKIGITFKIENKNFRANLIALKDDLLILSSYNFLGYDPILDVVHRIGLIIHSRRIYALFVKLLTAEFPQKN